MAEAKISSSSNVYREDTVGATCNLLHEKNIANSCLNLWAVRQFIDDCDYRNLYSNPKWFVKRFVGPAGPPATLAGFPACPTVDNLNRIAIDLFLGAKMLTESLTKSVLNHPEKIAIVYDKTRMSYQELYAKVRGFSKGLSSIGVGQGDCVALLLPNCSEFAISFYAIANLNGIVLTLNYLFKPDEINYYLDDSDVKTIVTDSKRADICLGILSNLGKKIELVVVDKVQPSTKYFYDLILPDTEVK